MLTSISKAATIHVFNTFMNVVTARRVPRVAVFWNLAQGLGTLHQWKVTVLTGASQEIFQG
eukprot:3916430-Pyramimonas_sp.AAC.1